MPMIMNCWLARVFRPACRRGILKSLTSSRGSFPASRSLSSRRMNRPSRTRPLTMRKITGDKPNGVNGAAALGVIQPHWLERRMPNTAMPSPAAESNEPPTSSLPGRPFVAGMRRRKSIRTNTTTVSEAKTMRQVRLVVTQPPMSGPSAAEMPVTPPRMP